MKSIKELVKPTLNQIRSPVPLTPTFAKNKEFHNGIPGWIDDLFLHFTLVYRHRWVVETDEIELATKVIWAKKLIGFDEKIIREAIEDATTFYSSWPPTVGQFFEIAVSKARIANERRKDFERNRMLNSSIEKKLNEQQLEYGREMIRKIKAKTHGKKSIQDEIINLSK